MSYVECKYTVDQLWESLIRQATSDQLGAFHIVMTSDHSILTRPVDPEAHPPWSVIVKLIGDVPHTYTPEEGQAEEVMSHAKFLVTVLPKVIRRHNFEEARVFRIMRGMLMVQTGQTEDQAWEEVCRTVGPAAALQGRGSIAVMVFTPTEDVLWMVSHLLENGMAWKNASSMTGYVYLFSIREDFSPDRTHNLLEIPVHTALIKK